MPPDAAALLVGDGLRALAVGPLQVGDPAALLDLPAPVRGAAAFLTMLLLGGGLAWRRRALLERAIDASTDRPVSALAYGLAAHAVIAFGAVYLLARLTRLEAAGVNAGIVAALGGTLAVLLAGALGFTVVGSIVADVSGLGQGLVGVVFGAAIAGAAATVEPLVGALVWFVVVSTGIGGPVRSWVHASAGPDR